MKRLRKEIDKRFSRIDKKNHTVHELYGINKIRAN